MVANVLVSSLLVCFSFIFFLINNNVLALSNLDKNHKNGENIYSINSEDNQFSYQKTASKQIKTSNFIVAVDKIKSLSDSTNITNAVKSFLTKNPTLSVIILLILSVLIGFITHKAALNISKKKIDCGTTSNDDIADAIKDNIINESIERTASETKENEINDPNKENKVE
ncbi:conserved rodent malaria protein, unknown function [Plasmodium vinckei vinckei]|uniref:Gametocyte-specific protein n=1 Tax=Plasmodium vinckei vinckei TaxID=54757 RepID=A0A449BR46_PLAVN|nr:conserved rodent malaria protein, unknown function [Plasmodium vinckei vinckei]KEG01683.1 hypothetical protein YYE_03200 [Plasmodium vinckei vinckei]VEV55883.1 conserved rodent malaria protein, unknown function [Plasmodium vinckei vinckei]